MRTVTAGLILTLAIAVGVGACGGSGDGNDAALSEAGQRGQTLARGKGCASCHGSDGQGRVGPAWVGLYGSEVELEDGTTVIADDDYLTRAITDPGADIVKGSTLVMPNNDLSEDEIADIIAYIRDLSTDAAPTVP